VTEDLAWYLSRLTEMTAVMAVSRLESIDKNLCYRIDKRILRRLLQGYRIPKVTRISVDEVYCRGPKQLKDGETRDDLFLTVIVDSDTRKVIWVTQSRRKEALDAFFKLIGEEACKKIEVVACDQHEGYSNSVREFCPKATIVWDRFHVVQNFNEALNEDRKDELDRQGITPEEQKLLRGKNKFIFMQRAYERNQEEQKVIDEIAKLNQKILRMEIIKERFHSFFDCKNEEDGAVVMAEIYEWSWDCGAKHVWKWIKNIRFERRFLNYFLHPVTTSVSEGFNHVIKNLKRQGCGYRDMIYFALKILQKAGYLNSRYAFPKGLYFMQAEEKVRLGAPKLGSKRLKRPTSRKNSF
jgi:transposase